MLREAQRIPVTPTREEVLDIGAEYCAAPDRETRAEVAEATGRLLASPPVKRPGIRAGGRAALGLPSLGLACWLACAGLSACTGSRPRDQRYGQDAGADFDAPAATGGAGGSAAGGTGGDATPATGGTAGTSAGGDSGAGGAAGSAAGGVTGQAGASGGTGGAAGATGQAGAGGGNAGNGGATAQTTFRNDWTAGPRTTKMLVSQV